MMDLGALGLCRDFLRGRSRDSARCAHCGSPRTVNLEAAAGLEIAHVDCDAFYASVEKRDDAGLRDERWLSAGRGRVQSLRRVVTSLAPSGSDRRCRCRELARSAPMPSLCRPTCPDMRELAAKFAPGCWSSRPRRALSIDEVFLDLTGCESPNGASAAETLTGFARRVEGEIGVTVSVGLSYCKFLAKLASDLDKPRAFALVPRHEAKTWLAPQSVGRLWGVGRTGRERLERLGFRLIGDLQGIDEREAVSRSLGDDGLRLWRLAQGRDDRPVNAERETKSISSESTFSRDISDKAELTRILLAHCDRVAARLRKEDVAARGVTLKLRLPDLSLRTRSRAGIKATQLAPRLFDAVRPLLDAQPDGAGYRLLEVAATELAPAQGADEDDLLAGDGGREKVGEAAIAGLA